MSASNQKANTFIMMNQISFYDPYHLSLKTNNKNVDTIIQQPFLRKNKSGECYGISLVD